MRYRVIYDSPRKRNCVYCLQDMDRHEAERQLANFKRLYMNPDGSGKEFFC